MQKLRLRDLFKPRGAVIDPAPTQAIIEAREKLSAASENLVAVVQEVLEENDRLRKLLNVPPQNIYRMNR